MDLPSERTKDAQRLHKKNQKRRKKARRTKALQSLIENVVSDVNAASSSFNSFSLTRSCSCCEQSSVQIQLPAQFESNCNYAIETLWNTIPDSLDPCKGGKLRENRANRKRWQTESFVGILNHLLPVVDSARPSSQQRLRVVDFGAGTGNFSLPLAKFFPQYDFILIEMKKVACNLIRERAAQGNLTNVYVIESKIEDLDASVEFDVGIAMHACGNATDLAQLACFRRNAAFVLCPCCIGKLQHSEEVEVLRLKHPRSMWLQDSISREQFEGIASLADHNALASLNTESLSFASIHKRAKTLIELDRLQSAVELGYSTFLTKLNPLKASPKNDCIIGFPSSVPIPEAFLKARKTFSLKALLHEPIQKNPSLTNVEVITKKIKVPSVPKMKEEEERKLCSFLIKRKNRTCRRFALTGKEYCSHHYNGGSEKEEVISRSNTLKRISSSQKRMVNPFSIQNAKLPIPIQDKTFSDMSLPIHLDIGCARGNFVAGLAKEESNKNWNFIGLEIRDSLVVAANRVANTMKIENLHYVRGNVLLEGSLKHLFRHHGTLMRVSIQFPSPWKKSCHKKRRMLQPKLIEEIAEIMPCGGEIYFSTDVVDVAVEMMSHLESSSSFENVAENQWLENNIFKVKSEREFVCQEMGRNVYRGLWMRSTSGVSTSRRHRII
eukprot:g1249.t1